MIPKTQRPKYVTISKGRYVYRPYSHMDGKKIILGKEIVLGKVEGTSLLQLLKAHEKITNKNNDTLKSMLVQYHESQQYQKLAVNTRKGYEIYFNTITTFPTSSGVTWGDTPLASTTPKTIRRYLDKRTHPIAANREIQYLKAAFSWAFQRLDNVTDNPCKSVDLNPETPRDRYVTDWEYAVVYAIASTSRAVYVAPAMELAYLSRARCCEVCDYKHDDILEEGLFLKRGKGSDNEITMWTGRLRTAVDACSTLYDNVSSPYLIHGKDGCRIRKNAFDSLWQRLIKKAMNSGAVLSKKLTKEAKKSGARIVDNHVFLDEKFTFHDLKAKGISDHQTKHGGHKSEKMKRVYDRIPAKIKATK